MDLIESSRALLELITFLALIAMAQLASAMPSSNGAGTETTLEQINSQKSNQFERQSDKFMQLHLLELGNNVTCNDGSQAGYYKRLNGHSKSWTIYLEGGGFCGSEESCQLRWQRSPQLMSSKFWPKSKQVDGILSNDFRENPHLWNTNHIYVPYCSSDSWTGLLPSANQNRLESQQQESFSFMGSRILEAVFESLYEDLPRDLSLYEAKSILLAGDSAGATGVVLNLDKMNSLVEQKARLNYANCTQFAGTSCDLRQMQPLLRGLADSGWFLDNEPYEPYGELSEQRVSTQSTGDSDNCDRVRCGPSQSIKQSMRFWNGQVPEMCLVNYPNEPWKCYFAYRAYRTLKTPLFVVQWLYDEAQLMVDNIGRPDTSAQWSYVNKMVNQLRTSLENVTALFAPACFSHSLILKRHWNQINVNGFKLPQLLESWEEQLLMDSSATNWPHQPRAINDNVQSSPQDRIPSNAPVFDATSMPDDSTSSIANTHRIQSISSPLRGAISEMRQQPPSAQKPSSRPRVRKRKRNNQQRLKQSRQRLIESTPSPPTTDSTTASSNQMPARDSNDLSITQSPRPSQDYTMETALLGRLNNNDATVAINNGRLGRSTIVDDTTLMLNNNNVPDDISFNEKQDLTPKWIWPTNIRFFSATMYQAQSATNTKPADKFRLIDTCGGPQCNRDCPIQESEYSLGTTIGSYS